MNHVYWAAKWGAAAAQLWQQNELEYAWQAAEQAARHVLAKHWRTPQTSVRVDAYVTNFYNLPEVPCK